MVFPEDHIFGNLFFYYYYYYCYLLLLLLQYYYRHLLHTTTTACNAICIAATPANSSTDVVVNCRVMSSLLPNTVFFGNKNLGFLFLCLCVCFVYFWFVFAATAPPPQWDRASSFTRFLNHTQWLATVGRTPLDKWSARHRDLYLTTHNTHNRQTSMHPAGFEPTIPVSERSQINTLDHVATWIDCS